MTAFQTFTSGQILTASQMSTLQANSLAIAEFNDTKASGTDGGSASAATTTTRTLNTTQYNNIVGCSLAANTITLTAGTYYVRAQGPAYTVARNKLRWRNTTAGTTTIVGGSFFSNTSTVNATLEGVFTITGSTNFQLQHYTQTAEVGDGFGVSVANGESEVYAQVYIQQLA